MRSEENLFKTDKRGSIIYDESGIEVINFNNEFIKQQTQNILDSFGATYGRQMFEIPEGVTPEEKAELVFFAPYAILSHDIHDNEKGERENVYNYANRKALLVFERTYQELDSRKFFQKKRDI